MFDPQTVPLRFTTFDRHEKFSLRIIKGTNEGIGQVALYLYQIIERHFASGHSYQLIQVESLNIPNPGVIGRVSISG